MMGVSWTKITDPKTIVTPDMHGKILKVGKKDFIRIVLIGMYKWWRDGFEEMRKTDKGYAYKKGGEWFMEIEI